jgi:hypothetical protein
MPVTLSHLKKNRKPLEVPFEGDKVNLVYKPGEVTPALGQEMVDDSNKMPAVMALARVLESWDVEDDSQPKGADDHFPVLPIEDAVLAGLPSHFLNALLRAIYEDTVVPKA